MKRLVKISALAALAVSLAFSTVACSDGDDDDSTSTTTPAEITPDSGNTANANQDSTDDSNSTTTTNPTETTPTETTAAEPETPAATATLWKFSDYSTELGATTSTTKLGVEKTCGIVVMGKNVKIRSDGDGVSGTITDGVTGYCQLSNGKDGSLLLTVPAGTKKITLGAKNTNGLKIVKNDGTTVLKAFEAVADSNYADYVYEAEFAEETKVYIGPFEASKSCNFKAIKLE